ncbi:TPR-like protein [Mycena maculata]|uniref:TPR-like protein n=1 Tax=Mycena maculata TaxID=230809 RepID=A0AAD7N7U7_9AGAR|nr:TPR-like protein [Mycena maculata]
MSFELHALASDPSGFPDINGNYGWNSDSEEEPDDYTQAEANPDDDRDSKTAETRIEDDFQRLVTHIRSDDKGSTAFLTRDWDFNPIEEAEQLKDELRRATGVGKARASDIPLSREVKSLIGLGNQAYVDGDPAEATRIMLDIIRIEPRAAAAWVVLAQCYEDMKQRPEALKLRIMAAHLAHDAEEWDRLARQSRELGCNQQALYCWSKAARLDPANGHAQWDRASLARQLGDLKTARAALLGILKNYPQDILVLSELRGILVELDDLPTCTALYEGAFAHYLATYPTGSALDPATDREVPGGGFGFLEILVLADLYNTTGKHRHAIEVISQGVRWLQGRAAQRIWDACEDDREYDPAGFERDLEDEVAPRPGMFPLDVNARHRLAIARIKLGDVEEAKVHGSIILSEDILDYAPLFLELADTYFEEEMYAEAQPIYEVLGAEASTNNLHVLLRLAACFRMLDELPEAADMYEQVCLLEPSHREAKMQLAEIYEMLNEPRRALEVVRQVIISRDLDTFRRPGPDPGQNLISQPSAASLFIETKEPNNTTSRNRRPQISLATLKEVEAKMENKTLMDYKRVTELWPKISIAEIDASESEWLLCARRMIEGFCEAKQLFTSADYYRGMFPARKRAHSEYREADEDRMAARLELEIGCSTNDTTSTEIFRGLNFFSEWLRIFFQFSFIITKRSSEGREGKKFLPGYVSCVPSSSEPLTLPFPARAIPYRPSQWQAPIRIAIATCAVASQRFPLVVEQFRKMIMAHQFNTEPLRIFLATMAAGGSNAMRALLSVPFMKVVKRELTRSCTAVEAPGMMRYSEMSKRFTFSNSEENQRESIDDRERSRPIPEAARKSKPVLTMLYAEMCNFTKNYTSAIYYYLQAYELNPKDPLLCLSIAIASIGRAMQRNSDNRPHLIAQGMGFLAQYGQLRHEQSGDTGEVEFNFGRTFQQLGLYSHAVTHYEKVLQVAEGTSSKSMSMAPEAAYNLSLIYAMTGAIPLAKSLYRRWLSF